MSLLDHHVPEVGVDELILDGSKVGWYPERIAAWHRGEKIAPITIDWALTRQCNYACEFCYAMMQENERKEQTLETSRAFLDDCAEIGVKGISLISDGESTVHPDYAAVIKYGASVGIAMGAGSNGLLLTKDVLEEILPSLNYLRFNFSGGERKRYSEIMGVKESWFDRVVQNIRDAMEIKKRCNLKTVINMQMVVMPKYADQILPLARLAKELKPDYLIYKHCADDIEGQLGVNYDDYPKLYPMFREAEGMAEPGFRVQVKWSRIDHGGVREYHRCMGPPFIMQVSGTGLVAPCGFYFNNKYSKFHVGNITEKRFKEIWSSDRYWDVMNYLNSAEFDPSKACGPNCLQHSTNDWLWKFTNGKGTLPTTAAPPHLEFI